MSRNDSHGVFQWDLFMQEPTTVKTLTNSSFHYHYYNLFNYIYSIFQFENFPDEWDENYFKSVLFNRGFIIAGDCGRYGVLALSGSYHGINVYGDPTDWSISNAVFHKTYRGKLNENGVIIYFNHFDHHYYNFIPLVYRYAEMLANVEGSLNVTVMNSRVSYIFHAKNKAQAKTYEKIYDDVSKGKPFVVLNENKDLDNITPAEFFDVKNSFVGKELIEVRRNIVNMFLTEIGINTNAAEKRERMIIDEVNANNAETKANISLYLKNINHCLEKLSIFGEKYANIRCVFNPDLEFSYDENVESGDMNE